MLLLELLNKLYDNNHEDMKSCLIILYTDKGDNIIKSLDLLKYKKVLKSLENEVKYINIEDDKKIEVISSDQSGVGKSTHIKLEIEQKEKKDYIHFPFGGVFNRKNIIERLTNLKITNNSIIHLDLYDTDQVDLMLEFLFSILITKIYITKKYNN